MSDAVAASVAAYTPFVEAYEAAHRLKVASHAARFVATLPAGARVLDVGCGPGRDLARLQRAGMRAVGVDLNRAFAARAARHGPVVVADVRALPFRDATFAGVWACASLVHLDAGGVLRALTELRRVAACGATVFVSVKGCGRTGWRDTAHGRRWFRVWTAGALGEVAEAAGLRVDAVDPSGEFLDLWAVAGDRV